MKLRKISTHIETLLSEADQEGSEVITRVAVAGIIQNPFAGRYAEDLSQLFALGGELGERLMKHAVPQLVRPAISYGKAAIVGVNGDIEHGHAMLHPSLGKAMREPIGGGKALIPSAAKIGAVGSFLDIPLGHKDDAWSFPHFDAMSIAVSDSPRPNEIMMVVALADGGRVNARVGTERLTK